MKHERLESGTLAENNAAFIAFVCKEATPYLEKVDDWGEIANSVVTQMLMSFRADNKLGFFGGKVEDGETVKGAAIREVYEEAGLELLPEEVDQMDKVDFTHRINHKMNSHLFVVKASMDRIRELQKNAHKGLDFYAESAGAVIVHVHRNNIENLMQGSLAKTLKEEIQDMIEEGFIKW